MFTERKADETFHVTYTNLYSMAGRRDIDRTYKCVSEWRFFLLKSCICSFILSCFWQPYECVTGISKVFWIVLDRCGSLWDRCGSLWVVVDRCGSFRVLVTTSCCFMKISQSLWFQCSHTGIQTPKFELYNETQRLLPVFTLQGHSELFLFLALQ